MGHTKHVRAVKMHSKETRIREAVATLWNPDADEIAAFINEQHGTNYKGRNLAQFMRHSVRGLEKNRPRNHNNGKKTTYRLGA